MPRHTNIPIEIASTVIAVAEMGSMTKAASRLELSQPAVTSQIKRIEQIVGGSIFFKTANGSEITELGKAVVQQARRMVEATSQLLALGNSAVDGPQQVHLGLSRPPSQAEVNMHLQIFRLFEVLQSLAVPAWLDMMY